MTLGISWEFILGGPTRALFDSSFFVFHVNIL